MRLIEVERNLVSTNCFPNTSQAQAETRLSLGNLHRSSLNVVLIVNRGKVSTQLAQVVLMPKPHSILATRDHHVIFEQYS